MAYLLMRLQSSALCRSIIFPFLPSLFLVSGRKWPMPHQLCLCPVQSWHLTHSLLPEHRRPVLLEGRSLLYTCLTCPTMMQETLPMIILQKGRRCKHLGPYKISPIMGHSHKYFIWTGKVLFGNDLTIKASSLEGSSIHL